MFFDTTPEVRDLAQRINAFMDEHVYPNERRYFEEAEKLGPWKTYPVVEELKPKARAAGLWNLFVPAQAPRRRPHQLRVRAAVRDHGAVAARRPSASTAARPTPATWKRSCCTARPEQQARWLTPLLEGEIRSCFAMTEPAVASSDATNVQASIVKDGDEYVVNGQQVVHDRRHRPALQDLHLHGQDRSVQSRSPPAAVDDPGADGYAGRQDRAADRRLRLLRRSGPRIRSDLRQRARAGVEHPARRRAAASRSRKAGLGPAASITACGSSVCPSACWS